MIAQFSGRQFMATIALFFALLFMASTQSAKAACDSLTVINDVDCTITFAIRCPGGVILGPGFVPANNTKVFHIPAGCMPFQIATAVCNQPAQIPEDGCLRNVKVGPGCCADICYDTETCTVTFTQVPGPCPCD